MRLVVSTPTSRVVDIDGVRRIRAEDRTGAFGIAPGHADFLTLLPVSVVNWLDAEGSEGFALVRAGVLTVHGGDLVEIAARDAYTEAQLATLGDRALAELERADETEDVARLSDTRLHLATMRQVERVLRSGRASAGSEPPMLDRRGTGEAGR
ncbi:hypothetical protein [Salipiger mucosus]|uniref:Putative ATP synthase F1, epsilon subunit n=1 Tax=Salipiger mucosus DSM 16094 TaxID=1123237 RepID=S9S440_9RHOB|nr:hypothetical protein [Salipiger mucosus]EPX84955.1 putative ATP synthase F1, epsilon subunit [Salipiger mucosus DSM 16094]